MVQDQIDNHDRKLKAYRILIFTYKDQKETYPGFDYQGKIDELIRIAPTDKSIIAEAQRIVEGNS